MCLVASFRLVESGKKVIFYCPNDYDIQVAITKLENSSKIFIHIVLIILFNQQFSNFNGFLRLQNQSLEN